MFYTDITTNNEIKLVASQVVYYQQRNCSLDWVLYYGAASVTKLCFQGYFINYNVTL